MKIAILGGGISGLSAAWYLLKKHPTATISLFEASERLGGWIQTTQSGPFLFEQGPRTFQTARCPALLRLIEEIGLGKELEYSVPGSRYLWHGGKLRTMGSFWPQLLGLMARALVTSPQVEKDESIYEFGCRRFGKRATELFLDPLALGIYAGDIRKLSIRSCFPFLTRKRLFVQKNHGLFSLRRGMGSLVDKLASLPIDIHLRCPVQKIRPDGILAGEQFYPADLIISALPDPEIASLAQTVLSIRYEPLTVVNLGYHGDLLSQKGYGYLIPTMEKEQVLGVIWDSSLFPVAGQTKLTVMVRGRAEVDAALDALARHLQLLKNPDAALLKRAQIPQYEVGHADRVAAFEKGVQRRWPNVRLTGNYLTGASVEACLQRGMVI